MSWLWLLPLLPPVIVAPRKFRARRRRQDQIRFIRETLAAARPIPIRRRIIVAMSTLPDRIFNLEPTIRCLLEQTRAPDEIVVAIPEFSQRQRRAYVIPRYLEQLPCVRILRCDTDWGPATKFIPAIQDELAAGRSETLTVVVDDDRIYPPDSIETYLHYSELLPDAALCFRGAAMPRSFDWHNAKMVHGDRYREPQRVAVITGCGSYLIKPRFFDESLWNYSTAPRAAFYMDDIWISGCLDRREVKKYVVPSSSRLLSVKEQSRTMSLHEVPNGRQPNNNEVIAFFGRSWNVFPAT